MKNFTEEMIEKAKVAKSAEEIQALAKENNIELSEEEASTYFAQLSTHAHGELSDDELDNVAGGGKCASKTCVKWKCKNCGLEIIKSQGYNSSSYLGRCGCGKQTNCKNCVHNCG